MKLNTLMKEFETKVELVEYNEQEASSEVINQNNQEIKTFINSDSKSFSVRMLVNGAWGFASSNNLKDLSLVFKKCYKLALHSSKFIKSKVILKDLEVNKDFITSNPIVDAFEVSQKEKIKFLRNLTNSYNFKEIKNIDNIIKFVKTKKNYLNSLGSNISQEFSYSTIYSRITGGSNLASTAKVIRAQKGYELLDYDYNKESKKLETKLKRLINATSIKPGNYDLVVDPKLAGVFFHEAVGHALEADHLKQKATCLKLGEQVSDSKLTLIDDPTIPNYWGSFSYDDEGIKAKPNVLIKNGKIVNFINDINSYLSVEGLTKTSNGRMESPHNIPITRMSNTTVKLGKQSFDELVKNVKNGLFVTGSMGGAVDPLTGVFSFKSEEVFEIKNGEIKKSYRGAALSGDLKKLMKKITGIGNSYDDDFEGGFCGKQGQSVPVSERVPYISVKGVSVGN